MKKILYYDCFAGISGDMNLGALVDLGVPVEHLEKELSKLKIEGFRLELESDMRKGISGTKITVVIENPENEKHRHLRHIEELVNNSTLSDPIKEKALAIFMKVAEAEAKVHNIDIQKVHFHEVGAVDAVIDVLGACLALEQLKVDEVVCSELPMGQGTVSSAHGTLPLPAPAVAAMLPGVPVRPADVEGETVTPTGAALVTTFADRFGPMPAMTVETVGVGAGSSEFPSLPNVLRAFTGTATAAAEMSESEHVIVECNLDDLDPRVLPEVIGRLLSSGALDAYVTPLVMKKGRPGHLLTALAPAAAMDGVIDVLLRETTSLGCRSHPVTKYHLQRRMETVQTPWGPVPVKVALAGEQVLRRVPEFDACVELAHAAGVPVRDVLAAATSAAEKE